MEEEISYSSRGLESNTDDADRKQQILLSEMSSWISS